MSGPSAFAKPQDVFRFKHAKVEELLTYVFARDEEFYFSDADRSFESPTSTDAQLNAVVRINPLPEAGLRVSMTTEGYKKIRVTSPPSTIARASYVMHSILNPLKLR